VDDSLEAWQPAPDTALDDEAYEEVELSAEAPTVATSTDEASAEAERVVAAAVAQALLSTDDASVADAADAADAATASALVGAAVARALQEANPERSAAVPALEAHLEPVAELETKPEEPNAEPSESSVTKPEEPNAEPSEVGDETASLAGAVTSTGATSGDAGSGGDGRVTGSDAVAIGSDAIATGGEAGEDGERSNWCMKAGMEPLAIDGSKSVPIDESEPLMTVVPVCALKMSFLIFL
jgi:hypothetical protein